MYVPDQLKLNKFRIVNLRSPKDYFLQYGFRPMPVYGDSSKTPSERKLDNINRVDALDRMATARENAPAPAPASAPSPAPASAPSNDLPE